MTFKFGRAQKLWLTLKYSPVKYSYKYFGSPYKFLQVSSQGHFLRLSPQGRQSSPAKVCQAAGESPNGMGSVRVKTNVD